MKTPLYHAQVLRGGDRPHAPGVPGPTAIELSAGEVVLPDRHVVSQAILVVGRSRQEHRVAVAAVDPQHRGLIAGQGPRCELILEGREPTTAIIDERAHPSAAPAADDQIVRTIAVQIEPGDAGAELAQLPWEEALP